jgi:prolipoprotein diacylglyceryltransferase
MFFIAQHKATKPGLLFCIYIILTSAERFIVDFWRADRINFLNAPLSFHQIVALTLIACATAAIAHLIRKK